MSDDRELWARRPTVVWRTAPGFLVVADVAGEVTMAEGPSPEIWELLDRPRTIDQLVDELAERYGAPVDLVRADVSRFLRDLGAADVVHRVAAGS